MTVTPANWTKLFEAAHGFVPSFTADEVDRPWCAECSDFHHAADGHSA
jgi:hypothetical protein